VVWGGVPVDIRQQRAVVVVVVVVGGGGDKEAVVPVNICSTRSRPQLPLLLMPLLLPMLVENADSAVGESSCYCYYFRRRLSSSSLVVVAGRAVVPVRRVDADADADADDAWVFVPVPSRST